MNANTLVPAIAIALLFSSAAYSSCRLDVASAPLDEVLPEVGRQCGVQVLSDADLTAGKTAPPLRGEYSIDDALQRLLAGAGLTFRRVNATTLEIRQARPERVTRRAPPREPELQEVVINGTAEGLVATRVETPLQDIPQTISLISREQMRQQNNQSVVDAMRNAPGITAFQRDSSVFYLYSRGFNVQSYALDGGGGLRSTIQTPYAPLLLLTPDISEFDHIEVLRGSNALFGADGSPGAAINLVRKRPLHRAAATFSATAGSWDKYRQEADITGPLAFDGALRGRLVVSNARQGYFYDNAHDKRQSVFAVLDYDLTDSTTLTAGGSYSKSTGRPFEIGLSFFSNGTDSQLPRDTSLVFDWTRFDTRVAESFLRLEQQLGENTRLRINATYFDNGANYLFGHLTGNLNPVTRRQGVPSSQFTLEPYTQTQLNIEATLSGRAEWRDRGVEWVLGGDYLRARSDSLTAQVGGLGPAVDPYNFNPSLYASPFTRFREPPTVSTVPLATAYQQRFRIGGLFASARVELTKPWSVTAGVRLSNEDMVTGEANYWAGVGNMRYSGADYDSVLTPYVGSLYQLNDTWSLYASYAEIYRNNDGALDGNLSGVGPSRGGTLEGGIKAVWLDGALNGSLGVFKLVQRDVALHDPVTAAERQRAGTFVSSCCWTSGGRNVSKGADLELRGRLTPAWLIGGGYTFNQSRQVATGRQLSAPASEGTPRHILRLWTDYNLPGLLHRWSVGATLNGQSAIKRAALRFTQESYALLHPRVSYNVDDHWQASLTVNNVFDRTYYETITGVNWNFYGEPRNYLLRLDARF